MSSAGGSVCVCVCVGRGGGTHQGDVGGGASAVRPAHPNQVGALLRRGSGGDSAICILWWADTAASASTLWCLSTTVYHCVCVCTLHGETKTNPLLDRSFQPVAMTAIKLTDTPVMMMKRTARVASSLVSRQHPFFTDMVLL